MLLGVLQRPGVTLHTHTVATNMAESGINIAKRSTAREKVSKKGVSSSSKDLRKVATQLISPLAQKLPVDFKERQKSCDVIASQIISKLL